jgi:hypothetical protein
VGEESWTLVATNPEGLSDSGTVTVRVLPSGVEPGGEEGPPRRFAVEPPAPNPFNPVTTLRVRLPAEAHLRLVVYDLLGRRVWEQDAGRRAPGEHRLLFDGSRRASGIYFLVVRAGSHRAVHKALLLK